jgi:dihydrofolate reductase
MSKLAIAIRRLYGTRRQFSGAVRAAAHNRMRGTYMRKLILKMSITVDGFVASEKSEVDWIFPTMDEGAIAWTINSIWRAGAHVMGSRTFHDMASYWPYSSELYAPPMNEIPKIVFSKDPNDVAAATRPTTQATKDASRASGTRVDASKSNPETEKSWRNARVMSGDLASDIAKLKNEPGNDLMAHGGASFARSLVRLGLVDEYQLLVHPVALGRGMSLFSELPGRVRLQLVSASTFPGGNVAKVYSPSRE